jgi:hypothetical protein
MTSLTSLPVAVCALLGLGAVMPVTAAGSTTASRAAHGPPPAPKWPGRQFIPSPGHGGFLSGVWCISSANCWAVGSYSNTATAALNQALHWNGRKWSKVPTPDPGGTSSGDSSALNGIACTSSRNCMAVGSFASAGHTSHNQALRWNGHRWALVATPGPGGTTTGSSVLFGVRCPSASDCWAVGTANKGDQGVSPMLNQVLHWNGRRWTTVHVPNPGGTAANASNQLAGASCTSAVNCWAVGTTSSGVGPPVSLNEALHWNGRKWATVTVPEPAGTATADVNTLNGVFCSSSANCWAAGFYGNGTAGASFQLNQVLHWNGRKWRKAAVPNPAGAGAGAVNSLLAVVCTSAANCWAVGGWGTFSGTVIVLNEALHWNGHSWVLIPTPDPAGGGDGDLNFLNAVRCASAALCWAVGQQEPNAPAGSNEALRWNGKHWSVG